MLKAVKAHIRQQLYVDLLVWNVSRQCVSLALSDSFKDGLPKLSFLKLLVRNGADPTANGGHGFAIAAKREATSRFRALCMSQYAKRQVVLSRLINRLREEADIVRWFRVYLDEQPRFKMLKPGLKMDDGLDDALLFTCMKRYPSQTTLLELLLAQGASLQ